MTAPVQRMTPPAKPLTPIVDDTHRPAEPARRRPELLVTLAVWLPLGVVFFLIAATDVSPLRNRAVMLPITALIAGAVVAFAVWRRWQPWWLPAAATGYLAAWVVLMLRVSIQGTPVAFGGHSGDAGRLAALATRYTYTWLPADPIVHGITGEYPPLLPWLAGRTGALVGRPGWEFLGTWQILFSSATVAVAFLLWRRLLPPWTAFTVGVLAVGLSFGPAKAFSVITLVAFIPLVLAIFAAPGRHRPHWLVAGVTMGLMILTYWGWFIFGGLGLLACLIKTWRSEPSPKAFLWYLAKVHGTALVISSWFVIPLLHGMMTNWGPSTGDTYGQPGQHAELFPFLEPTIFGVLQLVGLVGLVWLRRSVWWAYPLLALAVGAYAFRVLGMMYFFFTNHTMLFYYTARLYSAVFLTAGVLVVAHALPRLRERFDATRMSESVAVVVAACALFVGWNLAHSSLPGTGGAGSSYARAAFAEPLPDGSYTLNGQRLPAEERTTWYPATLLEEAVKRVRGEDARPLTVSYHERLYVYLPWPGYLPQDRGAAANGVHWDDRFAELQRLAQIHDAGAFADASGNTGFGGIDLFVLQEKDGRWLWTAHIAHNMPGRTVEFSPAQFSAANWETVRLSNDFVAAVRR